MHGEASSSGCPTIVRHRAAGFRSQIESLEFLDTTGFSEVGLHEKRRGWTLPSGRAQTPSCARRCS